MIKPADIIFVRYCPGAAGNFLVSLIQLDTSTAHWDLDIESRRAQASDDDYITWFRQRFGPDLGNHLKHEPHHPYQLDFISAKYPRGDDLSWGDFFQEIQRRNDRPLLDAIQSNRPVTLRLHRSRIPDWAIRPRMINVIADPPSHKWLHRTRLVKLFGFDDGHWISRENDPEFLAYKFREIKFHNPYRFQQGSLSFIRERVIGDPVLSLFKSPEQLMAHPSNDQTSPQFMLNLSTLFDRDRTLGAVQDLYQYLDLGEPNWGLVTRFYDHYHATNILPILQRSRT